MPKPQTYTLPKEFLFVVFLLLALSVIAKCATTSKPHPNSLGVVQYMDNPFTYKMGSVAGAEIVAASGHRYGTSITFSPSHTYSFFTEPLLFCGNESRMLTDPSTGRVWTGPVVLTYRTKASRIVGGVACHELESVDRVAEKEPE